MGYRLENKQIDLSGKQTKMYSGKTGDVYRYRSCALKVFREGIPTPIDKETAKYLTSITTERVLLPKKLLFYNNAFRGYSMKLVPKKGAPKKVISTPKKELVSSIEILERDIELLSTKRILLNGISPDNTILNGEIYLSDPSRYTILDVEQTEELEKINKFQLHLLLGELITTELHRENYSPATINRMKEILNLRDNDEDSSSYFEELIDGQENIRQMVKKIR